MNIEKKNSLKEYCRDFLMPSLKYGAIATFGILGINLGFELLNFIDEGEFRVNVLGYLRSLIYYMFRGILFLNLLALLWYLFAVSKNGEKK